MEFLKLFVSLKVCFDNQIVPAGVLVSSEGKIQDIILGTTFDILKINPNVQVVNVGNNVIMTGIVDSHVHVNEPGRTHWEGYETATKAAAAGGVTTIVDMPLNSIPATTSLNNLLTKYKATEGKLYVDVGFWGGLIPGNQDELLKMIDAGVVGFKCFMCPSGVDEFPNVSYEDIEKALKILEGTNSVLAFHAELDEHIDVEGNPNKYSTYLKTHPPQMEINAVQNVSELCCRHNARCHIVHVSAANTLPIIKDAKDRGCKISAETCFHYLSLNAEEISDNSTQFKCCPPIRDSKNREELWKGLSSGTLDMVVSDHSPCPPDLKFLNAENVDSGNFIKAWGGISSLQFGLSIFWTEAKNKGYNIWDIPRLMSANPAKLTGLHKRKGELKIGFDADFVIWDPEASFEVIDTMIHHKHKVTPYLGKKLYGKVIQTIIRGNTVYENGTHSSLPLGIMLKQQT